MAQLQTKKQNILLAYQLVEKVASTLFWSNRGSIASDREAKLLVKHICKILGTEKLNTTVSHPVQLMLSKHAAKFEMQWD